MDSDLPRCRACREDWAEHWPAAGGDSRSAPAGDKIVAATELQSFLGKLAAQTCQRLPAPTGSQRRCPARP